MAEIDQSGKVEQTEKDTYLVLVGKRDWDAVRISAKVKRKIQRIFRSNDQPRNYVIFTFCAGLSFILKRNSQFSSVVVDREYSGKEATINEILEQMLGKNMPIVAHKSVGKLSQAHLIGLEITRGILKAKLNLSLEQLMKQIKKTEVGKRLKNT